MAVATLLLARNGKKIWSTSLWKEQMFCFLTFSFCWISRSKKNKFWFEVICLRPFYASLVWLEDFAVVLMLLFKIFCCTLFTRHVICQQTVGNCSFSLKPFGFVSYIFDRAVKWLSEKSNILKVRLKCFAIKSQKFPWLTQIPWKRYW